MSAKRAAHIIKISLLALVSIFLSNLVFGIILGTSLRYYSFDTLHHFAGGFFVALFFYAYLHDISAHARPIKKWLAIAGATLFVGVIWEFAEFIGTAYAGEYLAKVYGLHCCMGDLQDTVFDLLIDLLGAFTLLLMLHLFRSRKPH